MLNKLFWKLAAKFVAIPAVSTFIIRRAMKTPYKHIPERGTTFKGGGRVYMFRYWFFNAYGDDHIARIPWLPSVRVHHICLPDTDRHEHDHPGCARSLIMKGSYIEERKVAGLPTRTMMAGDTNVIKEGDFHRIIHLSEGGVWTLFFTWDFTGKWGFWVDGKKIDHKEYK